MLLTTLSGYLFNWLSGYLAICPSGCLAIWLFQGGVQHQQSSIKNYRGYHYILLLFLFFMELSGVKKKVLQILLRESVHRAFGRTLLSPVKQVHAIPKGLAFDYKIPPSLCRLQKSHAVLSNAATLALFDEMSTYALFVNDKTTRGGVSVHLNTEMIQPAPLNENVVIVTTADKIGKSLSFCSMEMRNVKGDLLARGKHIKYMPMGWLWNLLAHPLILPWVIIFYQTFHQSKFTTPLDRIVYEPREVSDSEEK
eukprot:scaffold1528_cov199-Ochromonas_danica.AAC.2